MRSGLPATVVGAVLLVSLAGCGRPDESPSRIEPTPSRPPVVDQGGTPGRSCPAPPQYPTPRCTGVPPGTALDTVQNNVDGVVYRVTTPGEVIDGKRIAGDLLITADHVVVRNSLIEGAVLNEYSERVYPFSIVDSTVGPAEGCLTSPGVGEGKYTATRVLVRNHGDGFRASWDDVTIKDSFVKLCSNPGDHSDGIQTYTDGNNLTFEHNTVDQRGVADMNSPIFIGDGWKNVIVTNNLIAGGTFSLQVFDLAGQAVVRGNRVVAGAWAYGPVSSQCGSITWSDNQLVNVDPNYTVTSVSRPLACE